MPEIFGYSVDEEIATADQLRDHARAPSDRIANKAIDHVDDLSARFIAASPLVFVASRKPDGLLDVTPRGDPPGFVQVLDSRTLALPDRPGNWRMDTFENVLADGRIGLIFVIPGHRDTLRVSGTARLVRDARLGERLAVNGKPAEFTLLIGVQQVMCHCPKAFVRGRVWEHDAWPDTSDVPSLAELFAAHSGMGESVADVARMIDTDARERLY